MNDQNLACCAYHAQFCELVINEGEMSEEEIRAAEEMIEHAKQEEAETLRLCRESQGCGEQY